MYRRGRRRRCNCEGWTEFGKEAEGWRKRKREMKMKMMALLIVEQNELADGGMASKNWEEIGGRFMFVIIIN
jgi:hypothetical protein